MSHLRLAMLGSVAIVALTPAWAAAAPPTLTFTTDRGSVDAGAFSGCTVDKPTVPAGLPVALCYDGAIGSAPPLEATTGGAVTVRGPQPLTGLTAQILTGDHLTNATITGEAVDGGGVRFTLPADVPAGANLFYGEIRWEDATQQGSASYGVRLVLPVPVPQPQPAPPTAVAPPAAPAKPTALGLSALRRTANGGRLTVTSPIAGRVRLTWTSAGRARTKTVTVAAGSQDVSIPLRSAAKSVKIKASLLVGGKKVGRRIGATLKVARPAR